MEIIEFIKIGSVLILGSFIQSSSGFGFGLFALPLLLLMGFTLPETVIIMVIASGLQKVTAIAYLWKAADWKGQAPFMIAGVLALPLGVFCLGLISEMSQTVVKQVMGTVILLLLLLQWKGVIKSREEVPRIWGYIAGSLSGFLNGLANIGGPPLILWILSHRWKNEKMRVTPIAFSLVFVPFQLLFMGIEFGATLWNPLVTALLMSPVVLLGSWIGLKIGARISRKQLLLYMRLLLLMVVLGIIIKPFL
jgi:uncharacterized protein